MQQNVIKNTGDLREEIAATVHDAIVNVQQLSSGDEVPAGDGDRKKKPEIEPEKLPKEDPGIPEEEPDEDDDDDNPDLEPEIGDDPDKEKTKLPIM